MKEQLDAGRGANEIDKQKALHVAHAKIRAIDQGDRESQPDRETRQRERDGISCIVRQTRPNSSRARRGAHGPTPTSRIISRIISVGCCPRVAAPLSLLQRHVVASNFRRRVQRRIFHWRQSGRQAACAQSSLAHARVMEVSSVGPLSHAASRAAASDSIDSLGMVSSCFGGVGSFESYCGGVGLSRSSCCCAESGGAG